MGKFEKLAHRRAGRVIKVVDAAGNPVAGKKLRLRQTNHAFLFGCGAFDINAYYEFDKPEIKKMAGERMALWTDVFNYGTLPFYWGTYEPEEGNPKWESRMKAAEYMKERNIQVKGHPLCWHTVCADWLMKYDNETILKKQLERIDRDVTKFKGKIDMWDVINEVVIMPDFDKYDNAITRICKEHGRVNLIKMVFEEAKKMNPDATLLLNDFNTSVAYDILLESALAAGAPIDVIGIQSHQHQGYWGAEKLHAVLDRYSHFNMPIHFTENTLVSGELIPPHIEDLNDHQVDEWPSTPEFEERQMNEWEEMYRILFEHPLVEAVTGWDFADGMWLKAPSGFIHEDNTVKPVYNRLKEMIKGEWWTDEEVCTDENGIVCVEGFKGDYVLASGDTEVAFELKANSDDVLRLTI